MASMALFRGFPDLPLVPSLHDELFQHFPALSINPHLAQLGRNVRKIHLDITETKNAINIKADLPGCEKKDVKVHVDDEKLLTISVEKDTCVKKVPATSEASIEDDASKVLAGGIPTKVPTGEATNGTETVKEAGEAKDEGEGEEGGETKEGTVAEEKKADEAAAEYPKYICIERHQEFASRKLRMPDNVDVASLKAKLENGVLHITVSKMEPHPKSRQVTID